MISRISPITTNQIIRRTAFKSDGQLQAPLEKNPQKDTFEISIGYVNDTHGQTNNMMRILSGLKGDLNLSAGDNDIGDEKNKAIHNATYKFLNLANIKATALGNHEMDSTQADLVNSIKNFDGEILSINIEKEDIDNEDENVVKANSRDHLEKHIKPSKIVEVKGEKIGLIGASPSDMFKRISHGDYHKDITVHELDETIQDIQKEINNLKKQGVNKIILLSHVGHEKDQKIAQKTDGLDIIIGGHTHELVEGIAEGENLLYSKSGEPVILTEAGKDGAYFGQLNLVFDKNGVIKQAQNNLGETRFFSKNLVYRYIFDEILGKPEEVGYINDAPAPPKTLIEENPHANFVCDAMREEMGADIAVWNNSGIRNFFHKGSIDSRDLKDIAPFYDRVALAEVSEKTLVNMIKIATETSCKSPGYKPGFVAVSGLNYTVNLKEGKVKSMNFVDKNGNETPIDIDNPREDKMYKVATDEYMMSEGADYEILSPVDKCIEIRPYDKDVLTGEYIKKINRPIVINHTGRIKFED